MFSQEELFYYCVCQYQGVVLVIPPAGGADLFYDSRRQIVEVLECYFSASVLAPDPI